VEGGEEGEEQRHFGEEEVPREVRGGGRRKEAEMRGIARALPRESQGGGRDHRGANRREDTYQGNIIKFPPPLVNDK
jgi:hypothetical protein